MILDDLSEFLRSKKVPFKVNTKYHVSITLPDNNIMEYYPTKNSCMIRGVDDKASYIDDEELIKTVLAGTEKTYTKNSPTLNNVKSLKYAKTRPDAYPPYKTYITDGGIDLSCVEDVDWECGNGYFFCVVKTGIALEIPTGMMLMPAPRSSILFNEHQSPQISIIDAGYLGEITFLLFFHGDEAPAPILRGERVAQVTYILIPTISCEFEEVLQLPTHHSPRGSSGFGSTGNTVPFDV